MQRAFESQICNYLPPPEFTIEDQPQFDAPGVFFIPRFFKGEL
jgi:hypothetical protein